MCWNWIFSCRIWPTSNKQTPQHFLKMNGILGIWQKVQVSHVTNMRNSHLQSHSEGYKSVYVLSLIFFCFVFFFGISDQQQNIYAFIQLVYGDSVVFNRNFQDTHPPLVHVPVDYSITYQFLWCMVLVFFSEFEPNRTWLYQWREQTGGWGQVTFPMASWLSSDQVRPGIRRSLHL